MFEMDGRNKTPSRRCLNLVPDEMEFKNEHIEIFTVLQTGMDPHRGNIIHIGDIVQEYIHVYRRNENIAKSNEAAMGGKGQPL